MFPLAVRFVGLCWLVFWIWWIVSALAVKRTVVVQSRRWALRLVLGVLVAVLALKHVPGLGDVTGIRLLPPSLPLGLAADALALVGLLIMLWARVSIGRNWSGEVVLKEDHQLVTSGPYAYVRHPIYTGLLTLMLGTALIWGTVAGFVLFLIFGFGFRYKSKVEETFMTEHFSDAYPAYMKRTKAFIPRLF